MTTETGTTTYGYDINGELTSVTLPAGEVLTYEYDSGGNLVSVNDSAGPTTDYTVNDLNQYTSAGTTTYTYDANGSLVSQSSAAGTTSYTYNDENELIAETSPGGSWTYQYNGLGELVDETENGTQVSFEVDPLAGTIVGEFGSSGNVIAHFVQGLGLAEQIEASGAVDAYAFDGTGNTVALTGPNGAVVDQYSYLPSGQIVSVEQTVANPFMFVGQFGVTSNSSGLSIMGQRAYDPILGRFLQRRPNGLRWRIDQSLPIRRKRSCESGRSQRNPADRLLFRGPDELRRGNPEVRDGCQHTQLPLSRHDDWHQQVGVAREFSFRELHDDRDGGWDDRDGG